MAGRDAALPPDIAWHPLYPERPEGSMVLRMGDAWGRELARVNRRVDGPLWVSVVNRHAAPERHRHAMHPSCEHGMRMAEHWVAARADRIRAEIAAEPPRSGVRYAASYGRDGCDAPAPASPA